MERESRGKNGSLWESKFFCPFSLFLLPEPWDTFTTYTPHTVHEGHSDVFANTSTYYLFYLLKYHFCLGKTLGMVGFYALSTSPLTKPFPINLRSIPDFRKHFTGSPLQYFPQQYILTSRTLKCLGLNPPRRTRQYLAIGDMNLISSRHWGKQRVKRDTNTSIHSHF